MLLRETITEEGVASMKALPKRTRNTTARHHHHHPIQASMKALPKRKGNPSRCRAGAPALGLNESPYEQEGKFEEG